MTRLALAFAAIIALSIPAMAQTAPTTVPNGYACDAFDRTTQVGTLSETSTSATTAVFTFIGTTGATDVIQYQCIGY